MDESNQETYLSLSLQQLLEELESLIALQAQSYGNPWVSASKLTELFYKKYKVSPEAVAKSQGCSDGLRNLLRDSKRFSIYDTQAYQEFYVALLQTVVPRFQQFQTTPIQYRIKRPWKVDGRLFDMLKSEGAENIADYQPHKILEQQLNLVPEIKSVDDLKLSLIEIIKSLTANNQTKFVTIAVLSKKFCDYYRQLIKVVMRNICPHMKLIKLLQTIPNLYVQKVDYYWQVTVEAHRQERKSYESGT